MAVGSDVEAVQAWAQEHIASTVRLGGEARVDRALIKKLSGLVAAFFGPEYGGTGDGKVSSTLLCTYREGLARVSCEASTAFATQIGGIFLPSRFAAEAARREWVPRVVSGEAVSAVALTEPDVGSDLAAIAMPATRVPGGWRLSGSKVWIMKAPDADIYTIFARTSNSSGAHGITAFLVPKGAPGFTGEPIDSTWPDRVGRLYFDKVFVPDDHVIGKVDEGFRIGLGIFDAFRPSVGAHALGFAHSALQASIQYAKQRRAFDRPIGEFQAVSHLLAKMATELQAARLLVYEAARTYDAGETRRIRAASAMAKVYASEMGQFVVDSAVQIHGAVALEKGHLLDHLYREVRASRIYEGASEIQREIIARSLLAD